MVVNKLNVIRISAFLLSVSFSSTIYAQLTVDGTLTPTQLVQNVLLGPGVTVSNITYTGSVNCRGTFDGTAANIGFAAGVLLSCGDIANAPGPNNDESASAGNGLPGDPDLDLIMSPTTSEDATILEFDFVPLSDTVKFRYAFASEEYMEYVSSFPGGINDGFGFFISGPGINGPYSNNAENIAIIPGTTLPVTMFNLNLNNNGAYYFDNGCGGCFFGGTAPDGLTVQYDGFTVPLTAISPVQCGQTYHIKIAIGDGGDDIIDSGVFLEAESFSSPGVSIIPQISYGGQNDTTLYEGCGNACILFVRGGTLTGSDTVNLVISGSAVNGTDYYETTGGPGTLFPSQVIFLPGQDTVSVCINSVPDITPEGLESIILTVPAHSVGTCIQPAVSTSVYLNEYSPLVVTTSNDTTLCNVVSPLTLMANVTGGVQPYTYSWTNGAAPVANPTVNPVVNTTYVVTVSDACSGAPDPTPAVMDSIQVSLISIPVVTTSVSYGGTNDSTFYEGCGQACIYFVRTLGVNLSATYPLTIAGSAQNGLDYTPALPSTLVFAAGQDSLSFCIQAAADGSGESSETIILSIDTSGVCNLQTNSTLYIVEPAPLTVSVEDTTLCNTAGPVTLVATAVGGVQPYTYTWTNGAGSVSNPSVNPAATTTYVVTVNDACSGTPDPTPAATDSSIVSLITIPAITATVSYTGSSTPVFYEGCGQACIYFVRTLGISQAATYGLNISGTAQNGTDYTPALPVQLAFAAGQDSLVYCIQAAADGSGETPESILLSIDTVFGACSLSASSNLNIVEAAPLSITVGGDTTLNCATGPVTIFANASGGLQPYVYSWSNSSDTSSSQTVTPSGTTTYTVTVSDECTGSPDPTPDASGTILVTVNIPLPLTVTASDDATACPDDVIALTSVAAGGATPYTYLWTHAGLDSVASPAAANTTVVASSTTLFTITVTDDCGNSQSDDVAVNVEESCLLNIPNIISPDNVGPALNETFYIENLDRFPPSSLLIYNRFGNKIYESSNYQNNWNGSKYSDGTYYFVLTIPPAGSIEAKVKKTEGANSYSETLIGSDKVFSGFFQIVRAN
ncbi:MAG: choice-of-anchor L domain-containing protein [Bacteroidia bacterium]